jgi:DinB superfamily
LSDAHRHAWGRLRERMTGLTDDEGLWCPIGADNEVSIRWRLDHLTNMFTEPRDWAWLGCTPSDRPSRAGAESAADATQLLSAAYADCGYCSATIKTAARRLDRPLASSAKQFAVPSCSTSPTS